MRGIGSQLLTTKNVGLISLEYQIYLNFLWICHLIHWGPNRTKDDVNPANGGFWIWIIYQKMCLLNAGGAKKYFESLIILGGYTTHNMNSMRECVCMYKNENVMHTVWHWLEALQKVFSGSFWFGQWMSRVSVCVCMFEWVCQMDFIMLICHSNGHSIANHEKFNTKSDLYVNVCTCACIIHYFYIYQHCTVQKYHIQLTYSHAFASDLVFIPLKFLYIHPCSNPVYYISLMAYSVITIHGMVKWRKKHTVIYI